MMTADDMASRLADAFSRAGPKEQPGRAFWMSAPHGHPYRALALDEALRAMEALARAFPQGEPGGELQLPPGTPFAALWPWGDGWEMRLLGYYDAQDDRFQMRLDIRHA
jgi:hypothetical protein